MQAAKICQFSKWNYFLWTVFRSTWQKIIMTNLASKRQLTPTGFCYPTEDKLSLKTGRGHWSSSITAMTSSRKAKQSDSMITILFSVWKPSIRLKFNLLFLCIWVQGNQHTFQVKARIFLCNFAKSLLFSDWTVESFLSLKLSDAMIIFSEIYSTVRNTKPDCSYPYKWHI